MKKLFSLLLLTNTIVLLNAQNVGIGTETPLEKLEINGNLRFSAGSARTIAVSNPTNAGVPGNSLFIKAGDAHNSGIGASGGNMELSAGNSSSAGGQAGGNIILTSGLNFWAFGPNVSSRNGDIIFRGGLFSSTEIIEHGRMDGTTGNWGFGTPTPTARLDVVGKVKTTGFQLTTGANNGYFLQSGADGTATWAAPVAETDPQVGENAANFLSKWNGSALVTSGVSEADGNVGIGTNAPAAKLHIRPANDIQNAPTSDLILSRIWNSNADTRASSIFHYYSTATTYDNLAFGVSGGGGTNAAPNALAQIKMVIQANGNVGIGSITPANKLDVKGGVAIGNYSGTNSAPTNGAIIQGNVGIGTPVPVNKLDVEGGIAIGNEYAGTNTAPANGAIIQGRLGLGIINPGSQLDVYGDFRLGKGASLLTSIIKTSISLAPQTFLANVNSGVTYAVSGVAVGGSVIVSPSVPLPSGLMIAFAFVSSNGNVDVVFRNTTATPINYTGGIFLYITVVN